MKIKLITLFILAVFTSTAFAQTTGGVVDILIKDQQTGETLPFVNCLLMVDDVQKAGAVTDFDGKAQITGVAAGVYDLKINYVGYHSYKKRITVYDEGADVTIEMQQSGATVEEIVVVEYEVPLIDKDAGYNAGTVTRDDIAKMPVRSASCCGARVYQGTPSEIRKVKRKARRADRKNERKRKRKGQG